MSRCVTLCNDLLVCVASRRVMLWHVVFFLRVVLCRIVSRCVASCLFVRVARHVTSHRVASCFYPSCRVASRRVALCSGLFPCVVSYRATSCRATLCSVVFLSVASRSRMSRCLTSCSYVSRRITSRRRCIIHHH